MGNFIEDVIEKDLAEGKIKGVVTRFPPEPNGYLHIGHAKSILLNYGLAVKYGGKCNLRFDDTNPVKEDDAFVRSIISDARWLGFNGEVLFASDYFDIMYRTAVKLIKKGKAYVDDVSPEEMKRLRGTLTSPGIETQNRNRPVEENLKLFDDMKSGRVADGAMVLRAKIDMASPNMNMRDPIIYRVVNAEHHRQGSKWVIYPMYDFAHPIEDAVEGVTHSVCTLEFEDHRPLYDWVLREGEFENPPRQYEFARLNLKRTIMSKRYLKKLVDEGAVDGWDDPRMPTIAGLRRRGYTPGAIAEFCDRLGVAKANSEAECYQLESCIREELNMTADRAMAVLEPLKLIITNRPDGWSEETELEKNPNAPELGVRKGRIEKELFIEKTDFELSPPPKYHRLYPGAFVRLKGAYVVKCTGCGQNEEGEVTEVYAEIVEGTRSSSVKNPNGSAEASNAAKDAGAGESVKVKGVIHYVPVSDAADIEFRLYDYFLTEGSEDKDFSERMNPESLKVAVGKGESFLKEAPPLKAFQFMRQGYFVRDGKDNNGIPVYNRTVGLKDGFKKK